MALGYSVVNGTDVYPGHPLHGPAGRRPARPDDAGEGTIINGTGVQTTTNSRWGDYTSMNVDPIGRLHLLVRQRVLHGWPGRPARPAGWQTRIGAFKLPGL